MTVLSGKKGFLKLVCNFAMICDTLWVGQKRVICPALHKGPFHCRRIRPTIFDPWREVQPLGERGEEGGDCRLKYQRRRDAAAGENFFVVFSVRGS